MVLESGGLTGLQLGVAVGQAQVLHQAATISHMVLLIKNTWIGICLRPPQGRSPPGDLWTGNCLRVPHTQSPPHMKIYTETHPVGNCLRLLPSQSPPDMTIHSAEGNCLRPTPGQSLPIKIYSKVPRYYPETVHYKLLRYYLRMLRCGGQMSSDTLMHLEKTMASQVVSSYAGPVQRSSR